MIKNFTKEYFDYIKNNVTRLMPTSKILFQDWINNQNYVCMGLDNSSLYFSFSDKAGFYIQELLTNTLGDSKYLSLNISGLPKEIKEHCKANGIKNSATTLHRLVASLAYDLTDKEIHSIDYNILNYNLGNLLPIEKREHRQLFHSNNFWGSGKNDENIAKGYDLKKDLDDEIEFLSPFEMIKREKLTNSQIIQILNLRYIDNMTVKKIYKCKLKGRAINPTNNQIDLILNAFPLYAKFKAVNNLNKMLKQKIKEEYLCC